MIAWMLLAQVQIAPCVAITGADSVRADKCIEVPVTPPDTVVPPPADSVPWSRAMGLWKPTRPGDCTQAQHDAYSVVGPDGKRYPTWHPPVHPSGCVFGHEHGDDPATSPLDSIGPVLFGYVNEQAMLGEHFHRHEDHVGHKVFVVNGREFTPQNLLGEQSAIRCDLIVKLHQGTHSPDGFTNNLHEQTSRMACNDGTHTDVQMLSQIGPAGWLQEQCTSVKIATGAYVPPDSPTSPPATNSNRSMGHRFLPTAKCVEVARPNVFENWKTQNSIAAVGGGAAFQFAWYWSVGDPPRYWSASGLKRTVDHCYSKTTVGAWVVVSNPCVTLRNQGTGVPVTWDDEASPFKGVQRGLRLDSFTLRYAAGPTEFWTDVIGQNPSLVPFPGAVRQVVSNTVHNARAMLGFNARNHNYNAPGVRAPN